MRFSHFPEMPFSQQVTFPCELTLRSTAKGPRLFRQPIREIASLHRGQHTWTNRVLKVGQVLPLEPSGRLFHIQAEIVIPEGARLVFNVRGIALALTASGFESGTRRGTTTDPVRSVEMLVDRTSIETFVNRGELSCSSFVLPKGNGISLKTEAGQVMIHSLTIWPLDSAWPQGLAE
jgi:levanase/fructan beta-fructosidase